MNDFAFFFTLGWQHIISWDALDHLLFIAALTAIYLVKDWKQVAILVTAFTIGHSVTLALSVYDTVRVSSKWVEFMIPLTIVVTAFLNLLHRDYSKASLRMNYFLAFFFGLIHGLGYANTIRFMLMKGQLIGMPLFGFNVGLEVGQLLVVGAILSASYLLVNKLSFQRKWWVWTLSVIAFCWASYLAIDRWPL